MIPTRVSDSRPVLFLIDTGSSMSLIARELAGDVTKVRNEDSIGVKGISGKVKKVYTADDLVLQFAGFRQKNLDMLSFDFRQVSKSLGTEVSGILGMPLLYLFTLKIDYRDGLVDFSYAPRP